MRVGVGLLALGVLVWAASPVAPSTKRMAERLQAILAAQDFQTDPSKAAERADYYRQGLLKNLDLRTELLARAALAEHLLVAGKNEEAVAAGEAVGRFMKERGIIPKPEFARRVAETLAISYLRLGEQRNCLNNHNAESCIYPLRGGGVHADADPARRAAAAYEGLLRDDPQNTNYRWLLHLSRMAAGITPPVTDPWRIEGAVLPKEFDPGAFRDVAPAAGLSVRTQAGGVVTEDFDNDGYFDVMISSSGPRDQMHYFRNRGDGTLEDQTLAAGLEGETGGLNLIHADFNNDGYADVVVLRGGWWGEHGNYPLSLLRNDGLDASGQIHFTDVTEQAGLLSLGPTQTAAWADFDNDGYLDLLVGHESSDAHPHASQLFRNRGDGTFEDMAPAVGLANLGYVKGVAWGDFNNDGLIDLYVSRKGAPNLLFRNDGVRDGQPHFTEIAKEAGVTEPIHSFATWFFDYDNDGWLDLLVTGYYTATLSDIGRFHLGMPNQAETPRLYHNLGNGRFEEVAHQAGLDRVILPMGCGIGDLDNDGYLDIYFGTGAPEYETLLPNRMFRNDGGRRFQDATVAGGFGQLQKGHGISFADLDRDGDQDVFEVLGGAYPGDSYTSVLLSNPRKGERWAALRLRGTKSNRAALGARVKFSIRDGAGKSRVVYRTVNAGTSFGDSPFELFLGLRVGETATSEVRWPSGLTESLGTLAPNRITIATEGGSRTTLEVKSFRFAEASSHHH